MAEKGREGLRARTRLSELSFSGNNYEFATQLHTLGIDVAKSTVEKYRGIGCDMSFREGQGKEA